jgi:hypothetical protein
MSKRRILSILSVAIIMAITAGCGGGSGGGSDNSAPPSSAKAITAFSFTSPAATGVINENAKTISVTVPSGTNVTALVATFTTTGVSVKVDSTLQVSGSTPNNFTNPVLYTVTATDATTVTYTVTVTVATPTTGALIIDHNSVKDFDKIPAFWLAEAKKLALHYAHTSHGSQIISGILALEDSTYSVAVRESGTEGLPPAETPAALRIYDGNPPETYIEPDDYWDGDSGMDRTRAVANTGNYNFSMWSWCGQQSSNDTATVQSYLDNLNTLESEFPAMRFIYMTGHTDGTDTPLTPGTLKYNNNLVRQYVINNNKVLFDFADIESYDPDGNYYVNNSEGDCTWCQTWCNNHPADCTNLTSSCAHSHPYNCKLKAKAFWYMMARLAGWNGN